MVERYYDKNGDLGVLISPDYGTGWSTANDSVELALDKRIIEKWLLEKPTSYDMKIFLCSIGYHNYINMLGYGDLKLEFVPKGTEFLITEYDGSEDIEYIKDLPIIKA